MSLRTFSSRGVMRYGAFTVGAAILAGCNPDHGVAPVLQSPESILAAVHASPLNVVLAVGQTVQIDVAGQTLSGQAVTTFDSVRYATQSATDTIRVQLSPTGLVTGRAASGSNPVLVNVFAFKEGVVRADQVILQVTDSAITAPTLSIQPGPGESTVLSLNSSLQLSPVVQNALGSTVPYVSLRLIYHDADVGKLGCYVPTFPDVGTYTSTELSLPSCASSVGLNSIVATDRTGSVWVIADAMVYGVHLRDSVQYTMISPSSAFVAFLPRNLSLQGGTTLFGSLYIVPGGSITFANFFDAGLGTSIDVVFDNPGAATAATPPSSNGGSSGNIVALLGGQETIRVFPTPGTYHYTATLSGSIAPFTGAQTSGEIVVQ